MYKTTELSKSDMMKCFYPLELVKLILCKPLMIVFTVYLKLENLG